MESHLGGVILSCHDIGRGLNSVVVKVMELYDAGEISKDAALKIIYQARRGVHWCDGNEYEAVACFYKTHRCGRCLKQFETSKELFSVLKVSSQVADEFAIMKNPMQGELPLVSEELCANCFDTLLNKHCGDEHAGERERAHIDSERHLYRSDFF